MLLYYITDRTQFSGSEGERRAALIARIADAARLGVDSIQLREKDLEAGELAALAREALAAIAGTRTRLLINSRTDVALAVGAHGVHLTSTDISPSDARAIVDAASPTTTDFVVGVSCHSLEEVRLAESEGADLAVLAPIFEKPRTDAAPLGLEALRSAARHRLPIIALGGITTENAADCVAAGAAGVAGIRLFQQGDLTQTVAQLRGIEHNH